MDKLFLIPLEFGGADKPTNILYVPVGLPEVKAGVDNNVIRPILAD